MIFDIPMQGKKHLETIRQARKPVILFGAGNVARVTLLACQKQGIPVKCFCDTHWSAQKSEFLPYPLHPVEYITPQDIVLFCSLCFLKDFHKKLQPIGCSLIDYYWIFSGTIWDDMETKNMPVPFLMCRRVFS